MNTYVCKIIDARRSVLLPALAALAVFTGIITVSAGKAYAFQLDQPSAASRAGDTTLPILSVPNPVPANEDSCLPLLKSVRHVAPSPSATDWDRRSAGNAAALGLVFGLRFALGPQEKARSGRRDNDVRFDVWTPRDSGSLQAMAVAEYRRCKSDQALKALSDWRWER